MPAPTHRVPAFSVERGLTEGDSPLKTIEHLAYDL